MKKKVGYTPVSIFASCCGVIASAIAASNPNTATSAAGIGALASAIAGGIELKDDEASIKGTLDRSIDKAWGKINSKYRLNSYSEECLMELKQEIMSESTSVDEFIRNMDNQDLEESIAIIIQGILEKHREILNRDSVISWDEDYTITAAKTMASMLVDAVANVFQDNDRLRILKAIANSKQTIIEKVEDKGNQIIEEIRKAMPDAETYTEIMTESRKLRSDDTKKKVYTITVNSIAGNLEIETSSTLNVFKELYVQDEDADYLIELRDVGTKRKYSYQSRAIDMFVHDVTSSTAIKGDFDIYLLNYMVGKPCPSGSYDCAKMEFFSSVMVEFVKKILLEFKRGGYDPDRKNKDSFDGYIEQNGTEIFAFHFDVPTIELKKYCEDSEVDYSLLHFPRAGYYVADLGYKITMDYIMPAFYIALSGAKEEVSENPRVRNLWSYHIGPH